MYTSQNVACKRTEFTALIQIFDVFVAGFVRADLPGSQRPAAGCSDLQVLEDPG